MTAGTEEAVQSQPAAADFPPVLLRLPDVSFMQRDASGRTDPERATVDAPLTGHAPAGDEGTPPSRVDLPPKSFLLPLWQRGAAAVMSTAKDWKGLLLILFAPTLCVALVIGAVKMMQPPETADQTVADGSGDLPEITAPSVQQPSQQAAETSPPGDVSPGSGAKEADAAPPVDIRPDGEARGEKPAEDAPGPVELAGPKRTPASPAPSKEDAGSPGGYPMVGPPPSYRRPMRVQRSPERTTDRRAGEPSWYEVSPGDWRQRDSQTADRRDDANGRYQSQRPPTRTARRPEPGDDRGRPRYEESRYDDSRYRDSRDRDDEPGVARLRGTIEHPRLEDRYERPRSRFR